MVYVQFSMYLLKGFSLIAGLYFLLHNPKDKTTRFFVAFLALIFFVDIVGYIPRLIKYNESLYFLKNTFLQNDYWLYNPFIIIGFSMYAWYFRLDLKSKLRKRIIVLAIILLNIVGYAHLFYDRIFFTAHSKLVFLMGLLVIVMSISFYYYELLKSDRILMINKSVKMYISIGYLFYNLICMPVWIYSDKYYNHLNPNFAALYSFTISLAHILIYGIYIFAFIYCAKKYNQIKISGKSSSHR